MTSRSTGSADSRAARQERELLGGGSLRAFVLADYLQPDQRGTYLKLASAAHLTVERGARKRGEPASGPIKKQRRQATAAARVILQRGAAPPLHPTTEGRILRASGLELVPEDVLRRDMTPRLTAESGLPNADALRSALAWSWQGPRSRNPRLPAATRKLLPLLYGPLAATRLGLALLEALDRGWLEPGGSWNLQIEEAIPLSKLVLPFSLELLSAVGALFDDPLAPRECRLSTGDQAYIYRQRRVAEFSSSRIDQRSLRTHLTIVLTPEQNAALEPAAADDAPRIVIRSGGSSAAEEWLPDPRQETTAIKSSEAGSLALTWLQQTVFARQSLSPGQARTTYRLLQGLDCTVNLPSESARRQIVYLAALLRPASSLLVVPTEALAVSHVRGLAGHGIDRVERLPRSPVQPTEPTRETGILVIATADELRSSEQRPSLAARFVSQPVAIAAIDHAEAVSEWGPSFTPALAGIRPVLDSLFGTESPPPFLALTGATSREILRDILADVTDPADADVLVEGPASEQKLLVDVVRANSRTAHRSLTNLLGSLPKEFGQPRARFFAGRSSGEAFQGIIVCSRLDGPFGVVAARDTILEAGVTTDVGLYTLDPPAELDADDFHQRQGQDLTDFEAGNLPLIVVTAEAIDAVDAPSLCYLIHFGLPGAFEDLQRSARRLRRAGAGNQTLCTVIHVSQSERRARNLLSTTPVEELGEKISHPDSVLDEPGDLLRALRRHTSWFGGAGSETRSIERLLGNARFDLAAPFFDLEIEDSSAEVRQAIYRLSALGILRDWTSDGEGRLRLYPAEVSTADAERSFWGRALRTLPSEVGSPNLDFIDVHEPASFGSILARSSHLVSLIYETIEPRRREAIDGLRTLVSRAGRRELPPDHARLSGDGFPELRKLVASQPGQIQAWLPALADLVPQQAPELEQSARILLDKYPDEPGLDLAISLSALLLGRDRKLFEHTLTETFLAMHLEKAEEGAALQRVFSWLMPRVKAFTPAWTVDLWTSWEEAEAAFETRRKPTDWPSHLLRETEIHSLAEPSQTPEEAVVVLERRLREACSILEALKEHFSMEEAEL